MLSIDCLEPNCRVGKGNLNVADSEFQEPG